MEAEVFSLYCSMTWCEFKGAVKKAGKMKSDKIA